MKLPTTLSELKRLNAKPEEPETADELETEVLDPDEPEDPDTLDAADSDEVADDEGGDLPAWLQTGDEQDTDENDVQVPLKAHIAQRKKFQGNIHSLRSDMEQKDTQIEALTQTVNELKQAVLPQSKANGGPANVDLPPVLRDFSDQDDPEAAHQSALVEWSMQSFERKQRQVEAQKQAEKAAATREQELNAHYERAAILVKEGHLSPDEYRNADAFVRQAVEIVRPGEGRTIFNTLFADLGEGSEKVLISLYRNQSNLNRFQQELTQDLSGLRAASLLGRLAADFERGSSKTTISSAPRPGSKVRGDAERATPGNKPRMTKAAKKLKAEYDLAHKEGNFHTAWSAKRKAKAAGVDVSRWAFN